MPRKPLRAVHLRPEDFLCSGLLLPDTMLSFCSACSFGHKSVDSGLAVGRVGCKRNFASVFKVHEPLRHKGYNTLRRCLRVRQNSPAYAVRKGLYRFPVTEETVIGFGSPLRNRRMASPYAVPYLGLRFYGGHARGSFVSAGFPVSTGLPTRVWPPPFVW